MDLNLFWCLVGIAGGAVTSTLISLFFYLKGINRKQLTYDISTFCIISNKINQIEGLEVKYNSTEIENLYSATITIRNIGNSIIEMHDLAPLCPISISTSGQFLKAGCDCVASSPADKRTNHTLLFRKSDDLYNYVEFDFDYIPQKAVITFSLFYTGDLTFDGALKDGKILSPAEYEKTTNRELTFVLLRSVLCYPVCIFLGLLLASLLFYGISNLFH